MNDNPFKNYKQALKFLAVDIQSKTILSNYNPTMYEWAILRILQHDIRKNRRGTTK